MTKTEINHINETLEKLEREISLLNRKRSHLLSRLNNLRSATRNLPPEVLTEIFRLSACKPNLREPQLYSIDIRIVLKLGSICSHWRRVAWSAPHLWTTCLLSVQDDIVPPFIIALALSNSQGSCVSVKAELDHLPNESILLLFHHHRAQVRALRIHLPEDRDDGWDQLAPYFTHPATWPNLKELWVHLPERSSSFGLLLQIPGADSFHHCSRQLDFLAWYAPMHQLTVLRLHHFPIDQCLYLLLSCPNLIEFHCLDPSTDNVALFDPETLLNQSHRPKSFPALRVFHWKVINEDWNLFLFSSIRFPNLMQLCWGDPHVWYPRPPGWTNPTESALINDFMPSFNNITALDWETSTQSLFSFQNVFGKTDLNSLQQLYITALNSHNFVTWLRALTIQDQQQYGQHLLPRLRAIHVETRRVELGDPIIFSTVHNLLRSRRNKLLSEHGVIAVPESGHWIRTCALLERFTLETTEVPLHLEQSQMNALKALVDGGLIFELILPTAEFDRTTTLE